MCVAPRFFFIIIIISSIYLFISFAHFEGKMKLKSRCSGGQHEAGGAPDTEGTHSCRSYPEQTFHFLLLSVAVKVKGKRKKKERRRGTFQTRSQSFVTHGPVCFIRQQARQNDSLNKRHSRGLCGGLKATHQVRSVRRGCATFTLQLNLHIQVL